MSTWSLGIEARGYLLSPRPVALRSRRTGFIPVRKAQEASGGLTQRVEYDARIWNGSFSKFIRDAIEPGQNVLVMSTMCWPPAALPRRRRETRWCKTWRGRGRRIRFHPRTWTFLNGRSKLSWLRFVFSFAARIRSTRWSQIKIPVVSRRSTSTLRVLQQTPRWLS